MGPTSDWARIQQDAIDKYEAQRAAIGASEGGDVLSPGKGPQMSFQAEYVHGQQTLTDAEIGNLGGVHGGTWKQSVRRQEMKHEITPQLSGVGAAYFARHEDPEEEVLHLKEEIRIIDLARHASDLRTQMEESVHE